MRGNRARKSKLLRSTSVQYMMSCSHTLLSMFVTGTSELRRNQDNGSSTGSHIYAVDHLVTWSVGAEHGQYVSLKLLRVG